MRDTEFEREIKEAEMGGGDRDAKLEMPSVLLLLLLLCCSFLVINCIEWVAKLLEELRKVS